MTEQEVFRRLELALHGKSDNTWELSRADAVMAVIEDVLAERDALKEQNAELLNALKGLRALIIGECGATLYECIDGERADDAIAKAESHD